MAHRPQQGDVVRSKTTGAVAMILRTGQQDALNPPPAPAYASETIKPNPVDLPLPLDSCGISLLFQKAADPTASAEDAPEPTLQVRKEDDLEIMDRLLQPGDIVKLSHLNPESGVVTGVDIQCKLMHALRRDPIDSWVGHRLLTGAIKVEVGDRVIHGDWVGVIEQIFEEGLVESEEKIAWRIADMGGMMDPGRSVAELFPPGGPAPPPLPGYTKERNLHEERVIDIRPIVVHVSWIALSQKVPLSEQDNRPKPKRFWAGSELQKLQLISTEMDHLPRVGSKVRFKEGSTDPRDVPSYHFADNIPFHAHLVLETVTHVDVLWQSGVTTRERTTALMLHANIDEYDCWPGDHVLVKGDEMGPDGREAIVQRVDARERTAEILVVPDDPSSKPTEMLVSLLELDPHGQAPDTFGVGRGELVLIGSRNNGCIPPRVPRIGEFEDQLDEAELRATMHAYSIGVSMTQGIDERGSLNENVDDIDWYGEVKDLRLDGLIEVILPSGRITLERQEHLNILIEEGEAPFDEPMDGVDDEGYSDQDAEWEDEPYDGEALTDEEAVEEIETVSVRMGGSERDEWEHLEEEEHEEVEGLTTPPPDKHPAPVTNGAAPNLSSTLASEAAPSASVPLPLSAEVAPSAAASSSRQPAKDELEWERFAILEEADPSHHYFGEPVGKPNAAFLSRLQKEFKVLASSLPDTILVRSYEDRMDLLRVLIIGPPGTPYVDAPHLIDFHLDPTKYPYEPPKAHFHSWTSGRGRCSPNLYEEGKVCLSILGTWEGERNESWNPHKSSLLQIFVSIQGLVLVREPYFTEPAFEKLRGTKEARVSSRQYNEKAFVLTRGFILHALRTPIPGFTAEIEHLYIEKGRLGSALKNAQALIAMSEAEGGVTNDELEREDKWDEGDGVGRLTKGALIPLKRTVAGLEKLWDERETRSRP